MSCSTNPQSPRPLSPEALDELNHLLAQLSDEGLTLDQEARLNWLLTDNPTAQDRYLDHLQIDALIEREFCGQVHENFQPAGAVEAIDVVQAHPVPVTEPSPPARRWLSEAGRPALAVTPIVVALLVVWTGWYRWGAPAESEWLPVSLRNSGFEIDESKTDAIRHVAWQGDLAAIVGESSGVAPHSGGQMLRFIRATQSSANACEIHQLVDLQQLDPQLLRDPATAEASAYFNSAVLTEHGGQCLYQVTMVAYADEPILIERPDIYSQGDLLLTTSGTQTPDDQNAESWQLVKATLPIPSGTRYILVQLSVVRTGTSATDAEFPGQFVDDVALSLASSR